MIEMNVMGLALDISNNNPIILLRDQSGSREVHIGVNKAKAHNILSGLQSNSKDYINHVDLILSILEAGNLYLEKVIIYAVERDLFKSLLKISKGEKKKVPNPITSKSSIEIQADTGDAIALAISSKCGIWMLEEVIASTSFPVNDEADEKDANEFKDFINDLSPAELIKQLKDNDNKDGNSVRTKN